MFIKLPSSVLYKRGKDAVVIEKNTCNNFDSEKFESLLFDIIKEYRDHTCFFMH